MPAAVPGVIALALCEVTMTTTALSTIAVVSLFVGRLTQKAEKKLREVDVCKVHADEEVEP